MPDKETIFQRLYSVSAMIRALYDKLDQSADGAAAEMAWGCWDYHAKVVEDVQAFVYAMEGRKHIREQ